MKFEDVEEGEVFETGVRAVTWDGMHAFAQCYDAQPMHTDRTVATNGPFGDAIASGFQTLAIAWGLWIEHGIMGQDGRGGISLDDARWYQPVLPDDCLHAHVRIAEKRVTKKGKGLVRMEFELFNQDAALVLSFSTTGLLDRREPSSVHQIPTAATPDTGLIGQDDGTS